MVYRHILQLLLSCICCYIIYRLNSKSKNIFCLQTLQETTLILPFMIFTYLLTFFLSLYACVGGQGRKRWVFPFFMCGCWRQDGGGEGGGEREKTPTNDHTGYLVLVPKFALYFC